MVKKPGAIRAGKLQRGGRHTWNEKEQTQKATPPQ